MPKEKRKTSRTKSRPQNEQFVIGYSSIEFGNLNTSKVFQNTTPRQIRYYKEKVQNDIHWNPHGGVRENSQKVSDLLLGFIIILLTFMSDYNPAFSLYEYKDMIF